MEQFQRRFIRTILRFGIGHLGPCENGNVVPHSLDACPTAPMRADAAPGVIC